MSKFTRTIGYAFRNYKFQFFGVILFILIIGGIIAMNFVMAFNDHTYTITITDKERVNDTDSSKYLIFGELPNGDTVVLENTDELLRGKFNSSDIYGKLKTNETYEVVVVGFRVPFFSMYENIISYKET